jgi:hypothetical protein
MEKLAKASPVPLDYRKLPEWKPCLSFLKDKGMNIHDSVHFLNTVVGKVVDPTILMLLFHTLWDRRVSNFVDDATVTKGRRIYKIY